MAHGHQSVRPPLARIAVPVVAVAVAAFVRWALSGLLHDQIPLLIFIIPIAVAGYVGGWWSGVLTTFGSLAVGSVLFLHPFARPIDAIAQFRLAVFLVAGLLLSALNETLHRARRAAASESALVRAAEASLSASEARLRGVIESAMDAIISIDEEQRIIIFNPAAERMFKCPASEAIGDRLDRFIPTRFRDAHPSSVREFGDTNQTTRAMGHLGTVYGLRASGEEFPIEASISQITAGAQRVYTVILRDITGRHSAEEERERFYGAIADANRTKDEFLATLSHELRTPLNVMLGWIWRLRHSRADADTVRRGLEIIERNTRAQQRLIDDLLDLSRVVRGEMHVELRPLDLHRVVMQVTESSRPTAEARGLTISLTLPDLGTAVVSGDASRIQQVLLNLISNATKFTPPGGHIAVSLATKGDFAVIEVRDTGAGIPPDFLPHVFDQFRQLDSAPSRSSGGLGLGLAIVRHIVRLHGGRVEAESQGLEKGAMFRVMLPLMAMAPELLAEPRGRRAEDPGGLEGVGVIAVDDDADTRELLQQLLGQWGADVRIASSARHAIELVEQHLPDVLLDGHRFARRGRLRADRQLRARPPDAGGGIPAIALTAYATARIDPARSLPASSCTLRSRSSTGRCARPCRRLARP